VAGSLLCLAQLAVGLLVTYRVARDPDLTRRLARERRGGGDSDEDEDDGGVSLLGASDDSVKAGSDVSLSVSS
jgi:hypothetical protein